MQVRRPTTGETWSLDPSTRYAASSSAEAEIYYVAPNTDWAVTVVHRPRADFVDRLETMIRQTPAVVAQALNDPSGQPIASVGWPIECLTDETDSAVVGFLMPLPAGAWPLRRALEFERPSTYPFLVRAARNLSSAVADLHESGVVIGNLTPDSIAVTDTAIIALVAAETFQIEDAQTWQLFDCPTFAPEFAAPELQRRDGRDGDRTVAHDAFALGVVLFSMLMEGAHPFDALLPAAMATMPLAERIARGMCLYAGHWPADVPMAAPPTGALAFSTLSPPLQTLFQRCFGAGHHDPAARPAAGEWCLALEAFEESLADCATDAAHAYPGHLSQCPWCIRGYAHPAPARPTTTPAMARPSDRLAVAGGLRPSGRHAPISRRSGRVAEVDAEGTDEVASSTDANADADTATPTKSAGVSALSIGLPVAVVVIFVMLVLAGTQSDAPPDADSTGADPRVVSADGASPLPLTSSRGNDDDPTFRIVRGPDRERPAPTESAGTFRMPGPHEELVIDRTTPEGTFLGFTRAVVLERWADVFSCFTDATQTALIESLALPSESPGLRRTFRELLFIYDYQSASLRDSRPTPLRRPSEADSGKAVFVGLMHQLPRDPGSPPSISPRGVRLDHLKIDSTTGTATGTAVSISNPTRRCALRFSRHAGNWLIELPNSP